MTFRVIAYSSPEAPPAHRWMAYIFVPTRATKKAPAGETALPIHFRGATREAAVTRANDWWHGEKAKEAARDAAIAQRREEARLRRAG